MTRRHIIRVYIRVSCGTLMFYCFSRDKCFHLDLIQISATNTSRSVLNNLQRLPYVFPKDNFPNCIKIHVILYSLLFSLTITVLKKKTAIIIVVLRFTCDIIQNYLISYVRNWVLLFFFLFYSWCRFLILRPRRNSAMAIRLFRLEFSLAWNKYLAEAFR